MSDKKCFELERRWTSISNNVRQTTARDASNKFVRWLGSKFDGCGRLGCRATGLWLSSSLSGTPPATSPARRSSCRSFWRQSLLLSPVSFFFSFLLSVILLKKILNYDRNFLLSSFRKIIVFLQKEISFELSVIFINNITKICFYFLFFRDSDFTLQYFACFTYSKKRHKKNNNWKSYC